MKRYTPAAVVTAVMLAALLLTAVPPMLADAAPDGTNVSFDRVTCATTATQLDSDTKSRVVTIRVPSGGSTVYIGDASVTADSDYPHFDAGDAIAISTSNVNKLYCIVASGTQEIPFIVER